jgi:YD repeat-containing protein
VDDFGRVLTRVSPDTGATTYSYDNDNNLVTITDADSHTSNSTYDRLNRLSLKEYSDPLENISYGYDAGTNGTGRLTSIDDSTGSTSYTYNSFGQVIQETRLMNGTTYTTGYSYDNDFNLQSITYPGGLVVTYTRDNTGRITGTSTSSQTITGQVKHQPFGPLKSMTLGSNILDINRGYDQRYLLMDNQAGTVLHHTYTRDPEGKILSISGITDSLPRAGTTSYTH